ncbi:MAG: dUTP diphosphatase [Alphaproteobacteria bacterium]|nr:dUTP diphosphatase [Alphaproteobacteria bacterium]
MIAVQILTLPHGRGLTLPGQATDNAAGLDIPAAEEVTIGPGSVAAVATGFALAIPSGYEGQVRPRSGLALKHAVTVLNAPGTIDADYRGEVKVILINHGSDPFRIARGDRIAQLVIAPVTRAHFEQVNALPQTERGAGGFGSTGIAARKGA